MSIVGEKIRRPGPDIGTILSDYAKKDYEDSQDALRVLKAGDTMTGDLDMGGHLVRGLPKDLREYKGDEATSWNQVAKTVSMRKPVITVWAEQNGPLTTGKRKWSFGDGVTGNARFRGYTMLAPGRILRIGLVMATDNSSKPAAGVRILINDKPTNYTAIMKANISKGTFFKYGRPLKVARAEIIGLETEISSPEVKSAMVNLLIELDL